jgi:hypothetical protein
MSIPFNVTDTGIYQQTLSMMGVDSTQWPIAKVVNSVNNWDSFVTGYAIGADKRFQWDNTNHTAQPEGTIALTANVSDYSFLTDENSNAILTLLGVSILRNGRYEKLIPTDRNDQTYDISTFGQDTGTPTEYDKVSDNTIRLDKKPTATVAAGLKFYFQRMPPVFTAASTTTAPGVAPVLHRGYVIASAYDGALTLGLANTNVLAAERQREEARMIEYFENRNQDEEMVFTPSQEVQFINTNF